MKTLEEYHEEVKQKAIEHWAKGDYIAFKNMENDPVINLLLSALSYQAFHIQKNIDQYEENVLRDFRDRIIPFHLIKPVPAFSIVETQMTKTFEDTIADENCPFEFKKYTFYPLLETKIMNAELKIISQQDKSVRIKLESTNPIENLSGLSFYINDTSTPVEIEAIKCDNYEFPLIKPSQYDELPFTKWFNNAHLFRDQNYYLFGTYDYWQEIFLTNTTQLFYIGQDNKAPLNGKKIVELEIVLNTPVDISNKLKINCIPVVNVEKKWVALNDKSPVQDLTSSNTGELFLNLLYNEEVEKNNRSFLIRQHGVERYNPKLLIEQMREILYRYGSDYYAFQAIEEFKNGEKLKKIQEAIDEMSEVTTKFETDRQKDHYYAVLKRLESGDEYINLEYLVTFGKSANGIKKDEKVIKAPYFIDRNKTILLLESKGGQDSVKEETQKENIAKYYFQTKDRLVTPADIRAFIKTFYYDGCGMLGDKINDISIIRKSDGIVVSIKMKDDSQLTSNDKKRQLEELLKNKTELEELLKKKIALRSSGILPFYIKIS